MENLAVQLVDSSPVLVEPGTGKVDLLRKISLHGSLVEEEFESSDLVRAYSRSQRLGNTHSPQRVCQLRNGSVPPLTDLPVMHSCTAYR